MTFSVEIFTVCIFVLACVLLYICMYISMYVFAADVEEHQWYLRMNLLCLLVMYIFVCMYYVCIYVYVIVCICDCMYVYVHGLIPFPLIHVIKYYSYESILFHVPIGRRSQICNRERGCGRG